MAPCREGRILQCVQELLTCPHESKCYALQRDRATAEQHEEVSSSNHVDGLISWSGALLLG